MNEQNAKLESIKSRCKTAETIVKVLRGFVIAGAVIALICGFIIIGCADTANPELARQVESGNMTIDSTISFVYHFLYYTLNNLLLSSDLLSWNKFTLEVYIKKRTDIQHLTDSSGCLRYTTTLNIILKIRREKPMNYI